MAFQKSAETADEVRKLLEGLKKNFQCTICLDLLSQPVSTKCNHQFCRKCFDELLQNKKKNKNAKCPLCNSSVTKRSLHTNTNMVEMVSSVRRLCNAADDDCEVLGFAPIMSQRCKKKKDEKSNKKKSLSFTSTKTQPVNIDKTKGKVQKSSSTSSKAPPIIIPDKDEEVKAVQRTCAAEENTNKKAVTNQKKSKTLDDVCNGNASDGNADIRSSKEDTVLDEQQEKVEKKNISSAVAGSSEEVIQPSIQSEGSSEFSLLPRVHRNLLKPNITSKSNSENQLPVHDKNVTDRHETTATSQSSSNNVIVILGDKNKDNIVASSQTQSVTQSDKTENSEVKSLQKDDSISPENVSSKQHEDFSSPRESACDRIEPSFTEDIPLTPSSAGDAKEKIELLWKSYESPNRDHALFGNPSFSRSTANLSLHKPPKKLAAIFPSRDMDFQKKRAPKTKDLRLNDSNVSKKEEERNPINEPNAAKGQTEDHMKATARKAENSYDDFKVSVGQTEEKLPSIAAEEGNNHASSERMEGVSYSEDGIIPPTPPVPKKMKSLISINSTANRTKTILTKIDEKDLSTNYPKTTNENYQNGKSPLHQKRGEVAELPDDLPNDFDFDCEPMEVYTNEKQGDNHKNADDAGDDEICEVMYVEGNEAKEKHDNEPNKAINTLKNISQENLCDKHQSNSKRESKRKRESVDLIYPGSSLGGGDITDNDNLFDQEECFGKITAKKISQRVPSSSINTGSNVGEIVDNVSNKQLNDTKSRPRIDFSTNRTSSGSSADRLKHSKAKSKRDRESVDLVYPGSSIGVGEDNNLFGLEECSTINANKKSQQKQVDELDETDFGKMRRTNKEKAAVIDLSSTRKSKNNALDKQQVKSKREHKRNRESVDLVYPGSSLGGGDDDDNFFDQEELSRKKDRRKIPQRVSPDEVREAKLNKQPRNNENKLSRADSSSDAKSSDNYLKKQKSNLKDKSKKKRESIDLIYPGSSLGGGEITDDYNLFERDQHFTRNNAIKKSRRVSSDDNIKIGSSLGDMDVQPDSNEDRLEPKEATLDNAYSFLGSSPDIEIEPKRSHPSANNLIRVDSSLNVGLEEFQEIVNTSAKSRIEPQLKNSGKNTCIVADPLDNDLFGNRDDEVEDPLSNITDNGNENLNTSKRKRKQRISDSSSSDEDVVNNNRITKSPLRKKKMSDRPTIHYDQPRFNDSESSDDELPQLPFKTKTKDAALPRNTAQTSRLSEKETTHITPGQRYQSKTFVPSQSPRNHVSNGTVEEWKSKLLSPINLDPKIPDHPSGRKYTIESTSTSHRRPLTLGNTASPRTPKAPLIPVSQSTILPHRENHLQENQNVRDMQHRNNQLIEIDQAQRRHIRDSEGQTASQRIEQPAQPKKVIPTIVTTRISKKVMLQCRSVLSKLGGRYSNEFIPEATHLVVDTNENNALSKAGYTFKYLMALVSGLWIVNYKWLFASYRANKFVDEGAFEAKGDPEFKQDNIPRKYRLCHEKVSTAFFDGYCLCLLGRFNNSQISKAQLIQLLRKTAAEVIYSPSEMECSSSQMKTLLIADGLFDLTREEREVTRNNGSLVCHPDWVVESIINLKVQDPSNHLISPR